MDAELFSNSRSDRSKGVERSVARTHQEGNDADDDTHHDDQRHDAETHRFRPSNQRIDCTDGREALAEHLTRNNEGDDDGKVFAHAFKEDLHAGHDFNEFTLADVFEDHGDENRDDDSCRDAELDGRQTKVLSHNRVEREQEEERQNGEQSVDLRSFVSIVSFFLTELFAQRFKIRIKSFALVPILLSKVHRHKHCRKQGPVNTHLPIQEVVGPFNTSRFAGHIARGGTWSEVEEAARSNDADSSHSRDTGADEHRVHGDHHQQTETGS